MERTNKVYIVGTLKELKTNEPGVQQRKGEKDGVPWIGGTAVIQSGENEIEVKYFALEKTQQGKENKRYPNYVTLPKALGQRVRINGELTGRVFYNETQGQLTPFNEITAGFFNSAKPDDVDVATFEYQGFVTKPLHERLNKDEQVIAYEIEIGQANYREDNMQVFKFTVEKDNSRIKNAIESAYHKNRTVLINGSINYEVVMEERVEEVDFGDPIVKKFQNTRKTFVITGGKQPIVEEGLAYTTEQINELQSAYQAFLADLEEQAKSSSTAAKAEPAKTSNVNKLL